MHYKIKSIIDGAITELLQLELESKCRSARQSQLIRALGIRLEKVRKIVLFEIQADERMLAYQARQARLNGKAVKK